MATAADVADWIGISTRRVQTLRAEGVLPGEAGEDYDLKACVTAYCTHIRPASGKAAGGGSEAAGSLDEARIRLLTAQAEHREMLNEQMRGEAVLAEDMEVAVGALIDAARAKVLALPTKLAPILVGLSDPAVVREKLTEGVHECCGELAAGPAASSVRHRAKQRAGRLQGAGEDRAEVGAPS
jgi:hypothetical protein